MCTLILLRDRVLDLPLMLLMNRDEFYGRPSEEPTLTREPLSILAPRDVQAGGTWVGVNALGVVAAISNRHEGAYDSARRSRGLLCLEALEQGSALEVKDFVEEEVLTTAYNPFNLLYADRGHAFVTHYAGTAQTVELVDEVHVLANRDVDDATPRVERARRRLEAVDVSDPTEVVAALQRLAADHADRGEGALCRHGEETGTVSSTLIGVSDQFPQDGLFLHNAQRPCRGEFVDYSPLLEAFAH